MLSFGKERERWPGYSSAIGMPIFSIPNLIAGTLFSSVGFIGFVYGKKMSLWKPMFIGIALMAYPYFIESTIGICIVGVLGSAALFFLRD